MTAAFLTERANKRTEAVDDIELLNIKSVDTFWNFVKCKNIVICGSKFENCAIRFSGCKNVQIFGNYHNLCNLSHFIQFDPDEPSEDIIIVNNRFIGPQQPSHKIDGVRVDNGATGDCIAIRRVRGFAVVGNYISGGGELGITAVHGCANGVIANNTIHSLDAGGIWIGDENGIAQNIVVSGNVITDCAINGAGEAINQAGISIRNAVNVTVSNNAIGSNHEDLQFGIVARDVDGLTIGGNAIDTPKRFRIPRIGRVERLTSDLKATI